ncbi:MAG: preprotein translocase subunit SecG [Planctomycetota bacterium]
MTDAILTLLWIILITDAVLLVLIVLLQSGRGGGLSGMLGGGGGMESALGPKSGLPKITGGMAAVFFLAAILIGILSRDDSAFEVKTGEAEAPTTAEGATRPTTAEQAPAPGTAGGPTTRPGTDAAAGTANPPE